jgi:hypothetical protein
MRIRNNKRIRGSITNSKGIKNILMIVFLGDRPVSLSKQIVVLKAQKVLQIKAL